MNLHTGNSYFFIGYHNFVAPNNPLLSQVNDKREGNEAYDPQKNSATEFWDILPSKSLNNELYNSKTPWYRKENDIRPLHEDFVIELCVQNKNNFWHPNNQLGIGKQVLDNYISVMYEHDNRKYVAQLRANFNIGGHGGIERERDLYKLGISNVSKNFRKYNKINSQNYIKINNKYILKLLDNEKNFYENFSINPPHLEFLNINKPNDLLVSNNENDTEEVTEEVTFEGGPPLTREVAYYVALGFGLRLGSPEFTFASSSGSYKPGLYYHDLNHTDSAGCAFFGDNGTDADKGSIDKLNNDQQRVPNSITKEMYLKGKEYEKYNAYDLNGYGREEVKKLEQGVIAHHRGEDTYGIVLDEHIAKIVATELGLKLASPFAVSGHFYQPNGRHENLKYGLYYYDSLDPIYPNVAFFGTGEGEDTDGLVDPIWLNDFVKFFDLDAFRLNDSGNIHRVTIAQAREVYLRLAKKGIVTKKNNSNNFSDIYSNSSLIAPYYEDQIRWLWWNNQKKEWIVSDVFENLIEDINTGKPRTKKTSLMEYDSSGWPLRITHLSSSQDMFNFNNNIFKNEKKYFINNNLTNNKLTNSYHKLDYYIPPTIHHSHTNLYHNNLMTFDCSFTITTVGCRHPELFEPTEDWYLEALFFIDGIWYGDNGISYNSKDSIQNNTGFKIWSFNRDWLPNATSEYGDDLDKFKPGGDLHSDISNNLNFENWIEGGFFMGNIPVTNTYNFKLPAMPTDMIIKSGGNWKSIILPGIPKMYDLSMNTPSGTFMSSYNWKFNNIKLFPELTTGADNYWWNTNKKYQCYRVMNSILGTYSGPTLKNTVPVMRTSAQDNVTWVTYNTYTRANWFAQEFMSADLQEGLVDNNPEAPLSLKILWNNEIASSDLIYWTTSDNHRAYGDFNIKNNPMFIDHRTGAKKLFFRAYPNNTVNSSWGKFNSYEEGRHLIVNDNFKPIKISTGEENYITLPSNITITKNWDGPLDVRSDLKVFASGNNAILTPEFQIIRKFTFDNVYLTHYLTNIKYYDEDTESRYSRFEFMYHRYNTYMMPAAGVLNNTWNPATNAIVEFSYSSRSGYPVPSQDKDPYQQWWDMRNGNFDSFGNGNVNQEAWDKYYNKIFEDKPPNSVSKTITAATFNDNPHLEINKQRWYSFPISLDYVLSDEIECLTEDSDIFHYYPDESVFSGWYYESNWGNIYRSRGRYDHLDPKVPWHRDNYVIDVDAGIGEYEIKYHQFNGLRTTTKDYPEIIQRISFNNKKYTMRNVYYRDNRDNLVLRSKLPFPTTARGNIVLNQTFNTKAQVFNNSDIGSDGLNRLNTTDDKKYDTSLNFKDIPNPYGQYYTYFMPIGTEIITPQSGSWTRMLPIPELGAEFHRFKNSRGLYWDKIIDIWDNTRRGNEYEGLNEDQLFNSPLHDKELMDNLFGIDAEIPKIYVQQVRYYNNPYTKIKKIEYYDNNKLNISTHKAWSVINKTSNLISVENSDANSDFSSIFNYSRPYSQFNSIKGWIDWRNNNNYLFSSSYDETWNMIISLNKMPVLGKPFFKFKTGIYYTGSVADVEHYKNLQLDYPDLELEDNVYTEKYQSVTSEYKIFPFGSGSQHHNKYKDDILGYYIEHELIKDLINFVVYKDKEEDTDYKRATGLEVISLSNTIVPYWKILYDNIKHALRILPNVDNDIMNRNDFINQSEEDLYYNFTLLRFEKGYAQNPSNDYIKNLDINTNLSDLYEILRLKSIGLITENIYIYKAPIKCNKRDITDKWAWNNGHSGDSELNIYDDLLDYYSYDSINVGIDINLHRSPVRVGDNELLGYLGEYGENKISNIDFTNSYTTMYVGYPYENKIEATKENYENAYYYIDYYMKIVITNNSVTNPYVSSSNDITKDNTYAVFTLEVNENSIPILLTNNLNYRYTTLDVTYDHKLGATYDYAHKGGLYVPNDVITNDPNKYVNHSDNVDVASLTETKLGIRGDLKIGKNLEIDGAVSSTVTFNEDITGLKTIKAKNLQIIENNRILAGRTIQSQYDYGPDLKDLNDEYVLHHDSYTGNSFMYGPQSILRLECNEEGAKVNGKFEVNSGSTLSGLTNNGALTNKGNVSSYHIWCNSIDVQSSFTKWVGNINKHTYNTFNQWWGGAGYHGVSLATESHVYFKGFILMSSDERIKRNITDANTSTALDLINQMNLCKYGYKDVFRGNKEVYGFIAQQIKEVYPDAVDLVKDYIFDDMRFIDNLQWEKHNDKWKLYIEDIIFEDNHTGKCIFYTAETNDEDIKENKFKIKVEDDKKSFIFDKKWNVVFLHKREINDFHRLNKNTIYTIQHGAIQELSKKNDKLTENNKSRDTEINNLKQENIQLINDITILKQSNEELKNNYSQLESSHEELKNKYDDLLKTVNSIKDHLNLK